MCFDPYVGTLDMQSELLSALHGCFFSYYNKSHSAEGLAPMVFILYSVALLSNSAFNDRVLSSSPTVLCTK